MLWYVLGAIAALGFGVWVGLGHPGVDGRKDRVVGDNFPRRRVAKHRFLDWLRPPPSRR
jgi:hypothetical protein